MFFKRDFTSKMLQDVVLDCIYERERCWILQLLVMDSAF